MSKRSIHLREFQSQGEKSISSVVGNLSQIMGKLQRVGGEKRVYSVSNGQKAAVYTIGSGFSGLGLAWIESPKNISTVYFWNNLDVDAEPDYAVDLPEGDFIMMAPAVVDMIRKQSMGQVEA